MASAPRTNPVTDAIDTVKAYALQETVGPLKDVGRFLAMGVLAALFLGFGIVILMLALLRFLQTQIHGDLSFIPYLIVLAVGLLVTYIAFGRIKKTGLSGPEARR